MQLKKEEERVRALWLFLAKDTTLSQFVTDADEALFKTRFGAEGLTFVTVTLPALGKALDKSFKSGKFEAPEGWALAGNAAYPAFLHKAWETLFHSEGVARWFVTDESSLDVPMLIVDREAMGLAVHCIRQLTMAFYKYERPWTDLQASSTFEAFEKAEDELWLTTQRILSEGSCNIVVDGDPLALYLERAERLITRLLKGVDPKKIDPQYGTGATACKSSPWGRWQEPRFISKLDAVYPYDEWFFSGIEGLEAQMRNSRLELLDCEQPCARVVLVPKDSRGPRLISAEPREFMYIQQGLMKAMRDAVERYPNVRRQVSIIDQSRNQYLACLSSQTGALSTLDLKEASDRVSWWLVTRLFPENWVEALDCCRSESTILPSGVEIPLTKFAPMGSACCFPVEALIFWALANAARKDWSEARFTALFSRSRRIDALPEGLAALGGPVKVQDVCIFGDDIIVPVDHTDRTVALLEAVGLKVNRDKSFTAGPFRESCGGDFFLGINVTPVRVKHLLKGDGIDVVFRVKDVFNRMSLIFGLTHPDIAKNLRELFQEFFGFYPPLLINNGVDGTSGLVLYDYHWMQCEPGSTLKRVPDRDGGGFAIIRAKRKKIDITGVSRGIPTRDSHYCRSEIRVLTERACEARRDLGWSSVLRSFLISGGRGGTDIYALRKRVHHKLAWIPA